MKIKIYNSTIEQPADREILLKDVLDDDSELARGAADRNQVTKRGIERQVNIRKDEKSNCVVPTYAEKLNRVCIKVGEANIKGHDSIKRVYSPDGKSPTLTTMGGGHREPKVICRATVQKNSEHNKDGKSTCLTSAMGMGGGNVPMLMDENGYKTYKGKYMDGDARISWRKLTPLECERLQTLKDYYTAIGDYNGVEKQVSNTQRYRALGNGWTVEVIKHIYRDIIT